MTIDKIKEYECPDFVDLDEMYGFSQNCTSGTVQKCVDPCNQGCNTGSP